VIQQQTGRSKQKRQQQTRDHQQVRDAALYGVANLPRSDPQIEREIVYPSGQQEPAVLKQLRDVR
jgi:hypothetical protein